MRILITGAAGFLGSHLVDACLAAGHDVVGVDNLIGGSLKNLSNAAIIKRPTPEATQYREFVFYKADCNDFQRMKDVVRGADVVYHCAATAYEGLSVFSPHVVTTNIVTSTTGVLSAAIASGVKRFVNCSSMARYGTNSVPFTEDMEPRPQDPYGIGKVAAEQLVKNLCETHGIEWVTVVPHNIIGPRQKIDPYRNVATIMANMMLQGRRPIIYGDGLQRRCFSFVTDVVSPLMAMATSPYVCGKVWNVGPDDEFVTILELYNTLADIIGFKESPQYVASRPQEVRDANCSAAKARRHLGYKTTVTLREGLSELVNSLKPEPFTYHLPLEIVTGKTPRTWVERLF